MFLAILKIVSFSVAFAGGDPALERRESLKAGLIIEIENPCFKKAGTDFSDYRFIQLRTNGAIVVAASVGTHVKRAFTLQQFLPPKTFRGPYTSIENWAKDKNVCDLKKITAAIDTEAAHRKVLDIVDDTFVVLPARKNLEGARNSPAHLLDNTHPPKASAAGAQGDVNSSQTDRTR